MAEETMDIDNGEFEDGDFEDNEDGDFEDGDFDDGDFDDGGDDDGWGDEDDDKNNGWGDEDLVENDNQDLLTFNKPALIKQISAITPLTQQDIDDAVNKKVKQLAEELSLEERKCLLLLRRYKWNTTKIIDVYFTEPDKILVGAGVCIDKKEDVINDKNKNNVMECGICMDDVPMSDTFCLECGHLNTCKSCWIDYLRDGVKTKQCVHLTCPTHKCYVTIPQDVWKLFLSDKYKDEYKRYQRFCRENFVEVFLSMFTCDYA